MQTTICLYTFPHTYEQLQALYDIFIANASEDNDAFEYNSINADTGRSYMFYGVKVFEFYPGTGGKAKFKLWGSAIKKLHLSDNEKKKDALYTVSEKEMNDEILEDFIAYLREEKRRIFRNTITEQFACCNDYLACSDAKECIHQEDRFYNGCAYRTNLEAGRIFYGKNANYGEGKETSKVSCKQISNIIAIDFETANGSRSSACAIAAIKYDLETEKELDRQYTLINPEEDFDSINILIHGITPEMVADAPLFPQAMKSVFEMADTGTLFVAHNVAFDISVMRQAAMEYGMLLPDISFTCTYRLAKQLFPDLISYSLPDVAEYFGITSLQHHNAESDAETCGMIFLKILKNFSSVFEMLKTANLKIGTIENGVYNGIHKEIKGKGIGRRVRHTLPEYRKGEDSPFFQKNVAFTGTLMSMTRKEAEEVITDIGGFFSPRITSDTDILVTGFQDQRRLKGKEKSNKVLQAEKLLKGGHEIEIIPEEDFLNLL